MRTSSRPYTRFRLGSEGEAWVRLARLHLEDVRNAEGPPEPRPFRTRFTYCRLDPRSWNSSRTSKIIWAVFTLASFTGQKSATHREGQVQASLIAVPSESSAASESS